jgi:hypothetical protein
MKWIHIPIIVIIVLFIPFLALKWFVYEQNFGVITVPAASVYSATGKDNVVLFQLHEGTTFSIKDKLAMDHFQWLRIELGDGKKGWLRTIDAEISMN